MKNKTLHAKITVELYIKDLISREDLKKLNMTLEEIVRYLIKEESSLFGIVHKKYKIIKVEETNRKLK